MKLIQLRPGIVLVSFAALAIALICRLYPLKSFPDERAVPAAEDGVYEAVVRDMVTPTDGKTNIVQLVFDENVLTDLTTGGDITACEEGVRKRLSLQDSTPEFNSLADKIYRFLTRRGDDGSLRADTIQDFLKKSCTHDPLSRTFHTDIPRAFVNPDSVFIDLIPVRKDGLKDFRKTFPGAGGIISLSHVGFDSTLDEAIVSTSFVCGYLCGTGWRYILKKKSGGWVVTGKWMAWVS